MVEIIRNKLAEIEKSENIKILHCIESGSRAWGFASPDSDYDVRFIYARPAEYYLRLDKTRDVIEWQLDETLDINGWDIQKTLRLLHLSNPTLFEWNSSPIVYRTTDKWKKVSDVIDNYFKSKSGLYHYLSMAKRNYHEFLKGDEVKLKKYFYVLRPVLACRWILNCGTPPPMLFSVLKEKYLDGELGAAVDRLLSIKMNAPEIKTGEKVGIINDYLEDSILELEKTVASLPADKSNGYDRLNALFLELIK